MWSKLGWALGGRPPFPSPSLPLSLLLVGFLLIEGGRGKEREREKGGCAPFPLSNSDSLMGGAALLVGCPLSPLWPRLAHYFPRGVPVTSRYSRKIPESLGTIPMSEYHLPIYESLPLDHFETPRHVRDLIRDSEQHSVTNHITHIILYHHRTLSVRTLRVRE
jgi:hypothetical protein